MKTNVDDYIKIESDIEWIETQKYLFSLGYKWCDNTQDIIPRDNYPYPEYILIEIDHKNLYENLNGNFMFSYSHKPPEKSIIHNASKILRKNKLNKLKNLDI